MRSDQESTMEREQRFEAVHEQCVDRVMAWCLRHAGPQMAEDVVAETFAIAWHKLDQVPEPPLPWLLVTARHTLQAHWRGASRQGQIAERLVPLSELASPSPELGTERRSEILDALSQLSPDDREAMLLIAWDGLTPTQAARVMGVSPGTLRVRLHRARAALRRRAAADDEETAPRAMHPPRRPITSRPLNTTGVPHA